jgi:hypothetical protein
LRPIERWLFTYAFLPDGADDSVQIDAAVLVKALVLDRHDRELHLVRDLVRGNEDAALPAPENGEDALALPVVDVPVDLALLQPGRVERGDLARDRGHQPEGKGQGPEHEEDQEEAEQAQLADPAPRP